LLGINFQNITESAELAIMHPQGNLIAVGETMNNEYAVQLTAIHPLANMFIPKNSQTVHGSLCH
jgi:hypothetical protein